MLTWILESEVRLGLRVLVVDDVLADVLGENLVEDVVHRQAEAGLVLEQLLHQEGVEVVGVHHVVPGRQQSQLGNTTNILSDYFFVSFYVEDI